MDFQFVLGLVLRWLHILAAITAVGGALFARFVVFPTLDGWPPEERARLHAALRARWSGVLAVAIGFLLLSGLINIAITLTRFNVPRWYHVVFGIKFLLALVVFALASLLAGKTPLADQLRRNARFWLNLNLLLAVTVVCLSGVLRTAEKVPKNRPNVEAAAPAGAAPAKNDLHLPTG